MFDEAMKFVGFVGPPCILSYISAGVLVRFCSSSYSRWRRRISSTRRSLSITSRCFVNVMRRTPSLSHNRNVK